MAQQPTLTLKGYHKDLIFKFCVENLPRWNYCVIYIVFHHEDYNLICYADNNVDKIRETISYMNNNSYDVYDVINIIYLCTTSKNILFQIEELTRISI